MDKKLWPTLVTSVGLTSVCAATLASAAASEPVTIHLTTARQDAGKFAQATLVPQGDATEIVLFVSGVPSNAALPPRLYTYVYPGTCGSLGAKPVVAMNQLTVLGDNVPYQMTKLAPIALHELRTGDYALVVRTSPTDGYVGVFCGNLKQAA
jgi:hypothetical protein